MTEREFVAGIVLYNPEDNQFIDSIQRLIELEVSVVVFDNSNSDPVRLRNEGNIKSNHFDDVTYLSSTRGNIGLAKAYNKIVLEIRSRICSKGLFLFDQDTFINKEAIDILIETFRFLEKKEDFASVSGFPVRENGVPYRFHVFDKRQTKEDLIRVKQVPSSFSLINISSFDRIGLFNSDYFIDNIDIDYSIRCNKANLPVYIKKSAKFTHKVGIGDVVLFGKTWFPVADAYRHYYQTRNLILCSKYNKLSFISTLYITTERLIIILVIGIYTKEFKNRITYAIKGVLDGIKGVSGKLNG